MLRDGRPDEPGLTRLNTMYGFTLSTPDRATRYVSRRTIKNLMLRWGAACEGHALYYFGVSGPRYVGVICNGVLVRPL